MTSKVDGFVKVATQHLHKVKTETEQLQSKELEALTVISDRIKEQLEKLQKALILIHAKEDTAQDAVNTIRSTITEVQEGIKSGFASQADELRKHCESICKEAESSSMASCAAVRSVILLVHLILILGVG